MTFFKNFTNWFNIKPKLDKDKQRPLFQEREVWMTHLGNNIGFEMNGKNLESLRPSIVFKKLSSNTLLIIPLTSSLKNGSWYSTSYVKGVKGRFCLNQIRMIDSKRLKYWIERIDELNFKNLQKDFDKMLKN